MPRLVFCRVGGIPFAAREADSLSAGAKTAIGQVDAVAPCMRVRRVLSSLPFGRLISFLAVGLVGLGVDSAIFQLCYRAGVALPSARALSLVTATLVTWLLNRTVTFDPSGRAASAEAFRYASVAALVQGFNYLLFLSLAKLFPATQPLIFLLIAAIAAAAFSFAGQSLFAFAAHRRAIPVPTDANHPQATHVEL